MVQKIRFIKGSLNQHLHELKTSLILIPLLLLIFLIWFGWSVLIPRFYSWAYPAFDSMELVKARTFNYRTSDRADSIYDAAVQFKIVKSSTCVYKNMAFFAILDGGILYDIKVRLPGSYNRLPGIYISDYWLLENIPSDSNEIKAIIYHKCPVTTWLTETIVGPYDLKKVESDSK